MSEKPQLINIHIKIYYISMLILWKHRSLLVKVLRLLHPGLWFESETMQFIADYRKSRFQVPEREIY